MNNTTKLRSGQLVFLQRIIEEVNQNIFIKITQFSWYKYVDLHRQKFIAEKLCPICNCSLKYLPQRNVIALQ